MRYNNDINYILNLIRLIFCYPVYMVEKGNCRKNVNLKSTQFVDLVRSIVVFIQK